MGKTTKNPRVLSVTAVLAVFALAAVAWATGLFGSRDGVGPAPASAAALEPFSDCDEVLGYVRDHRWALGGPGFPLPLTGRATGVTAVEDAAAPEAAATAENAVGPSATGTNIQEAGIDEPDLAKLGGDALWVLRKRTLQAWDVRGEEPALVSELELGDAGGRDAQLLLSGDRALVFSQATRRPDFVPSTLVAEVDIGEPAEPALIRSAEIEGAYVNARLRGETAHLVIASRPDYPVEPPQPPGGPIPELAPDERPPSGATGETGPEPEDPDVPDWVPTLTLADAETGESATAPLFECGDVSYPGDFAGLGTVSVLTIDAEAGLPAVDTDTVMTDGHTVYASAESLYVATEKVENPGGGVIGSVGRAVVPDTDVIAPPVFSPDTAIHRFDVTSPDETAYAASGEIPGRILNEWSLSEHDGYLRVAATEGDPFASGPNESETVVTVLEQRDGALAPVGRAGGLGRGETIFGVRFIGEMGYVVTFEQTDPLYTVDLSDPESPEVTGELKIPGYSAYLHPVGDDLILGIGQDGTGDGMLTGAQASLFDVSDPEEPQRTDTLNLLDDRFASAQAEWDHHAFLYWPPESLAAVPVTSYGRDADASAVAFRVTSEDGLEEVAKLGDGEGRIQRMLVAEDRLLTVSPAGVESRPLDGLGA